MPFARADRLALWRARSRHETLETLISVWLLASMGAQAALFVAHIAWVSPATPWADLVTGYLLLASAAVTYLCSCYWPHAFMMVLFTSLVGFPLLKLFVVDIAGFV